MRSSRLSPAFVSELQRQDTRRADELRSVSRRGWKQDGVAGEAGFESIAGRFLLSFRGFADPRRAGHWPDSRQLALAIMVRVHTQRVIEQLPLAEFNGGASIWLEKLSR